MSKKYDFDLAVIGAGSGGLVGAVGAVKLGLTVALIDGGLIGGDCLNYGCVPSKSLLHAAKVAKTIRGAHRFGINTQEPTIDYDAVKAYVHGVQDTIRAHEDAAWFRRMGMDVFEEFASFVDPHTLKVGSRQITARIILIATGSRTAIPPIEGLKGVGFLTNEDIFSMPELPGHLAIIGGGPIGTEMAWAHRQLGCEVTLIQSGPEILSKDDPDMAIVVRESMEADGIKIHRQARVSNVAKTESARTCITFEQHGQSFSFEADELLVCAGRQPNVDRLDLENAGVKYTQKGIEIDGSQRTSVKHIYAVGDVTGGLMFTHSASLQAGTFIKSAIFHLPAKTSFNAFPWVTYTDPELASVGLNETEAKRRGIPYKLAESDFAHNDRALAESSTAGKIKVLMEPSRLLGMRGGRILGVQIVGPHAGELIHEYVVMMQNGIKASKVTGAVHAYPTLAEINKRAVSSYLGESLFQPRTRLWLKRLFGYAGVLHPGREGADG